MGTRLCRLKGSVKNEALANKKKLSGKRLLTDKLIDQIQSYYGLAISRIVSVVKFKRQTV